MPPRHRVSYLILSHRDPDLVERLVTRIEALSPNAAVVVTHDNEDEIPRLQALEGDRVAVLGRRSHGEWGDWSLVEATLDAITVARARFSPEWLVLISGHDHPVTPLADWESTHLTDKVDAIFGELEPEVPLHLHGRPTPELLRASKYTHQWVKVPTQGRHRPLWLAGELTRWQSTVLVNPYPRGLPWRVGVRRRRLPFEHVYRASQWCAIRASLLDDAPLGTAVQYFRETICPDEAFFPTIAHAAGGRISPAGVTTVNWGETETQPIDGKTVERAIAAGTAFVRKVDASVDPELLERIDALSVAAPQNRDREGYA